MKKLTVTVTFFRYIYIYLFYLTVMPADFIINTTCRRRILAFIILLYCSIVQGFGSSEGPYPVLSAGRVREIADKAFALNDKKEFERSIDLIKPLAMNIDRYDFSDKVLMSDVYFLAGFYYSAIREYNKAIDLTEKSVAYRDEAGVFDVRYGKCYTNLAAFWYTLGEHANALEYAKKAIEFWKKITPASPKNLATSYLNIASIYLELFETGKAYEYAEDGLQLSKLYPDEVSIGTQADFYQDISISLTRAGESAKALIYANEALRLYSGVINEKSASWAGMIDNVAVIYRKMNQPEMEEKYLKMGIEHSTPETVESTFRLVIEYALFLIERKQYDEAGKILSEAIAKTDKKKRPESIAYAMLSATYGSMLFSRDKDSGEATRYYMQSFMYIKSHPWDYRTNEYILYNYASMLSETGKNEDALTVLNNLLEPYDIERFGYEEVRHSEIKLSENVPGMLYLKYKVLNALAAKTGSKTYTLLAITCGEALTKIYDNKMLEMSEDQSRAILSANTRSFYTEMIDNYCTLYKAEKSRVYLEKAFEYSERSKVAGFLAVTRQLNATRFSIPPDLLSVENKLRNKIGSYREMINKERTIQNSDSNKILKLEQKDFMYTRSLDSLEGIFEKNYPAYYNLKYNTRTASLESVPRIIGPKENLISYILSGNKLYIFVVNQSYNEVIIEDAGKEFHTRLERFRKILSTMPSSTDARASFTEYMDIAYYLYSFLIQPAEPFLVSNKLTISTDNFLSYIPFESLITSDYHSDDLLYRNAPFLVKKKDISYVFSVTLSSETKDLSLRLRNRVAAFAPDYSARQPADSLIKYFPKLKGNIPDLPFACDEAQTAVKLCGGETFMGQSATEDSFKREASHFEIIHLAMHTLLDDENPLYSKMIFTESDKSANDGLLNTYEVYNVPIKARMVVLSSCNTGSGRLMSGEGIQSLARGFISSGGKSVVMSMWEVEDFAGSEIVKDFYRDVKLGETKSRALRNAKLDFLKNADQRRSHPYYWSTLVVYGDDSPLYYSPVRIALASFAIITVLLLLGFIFYRDVKS